MRDQNPANKNAVPTPIYEYRLEDETEREIPPITEDFEDWQDWNASLYETRNGEE
jgi:hypothetical protein